MEYVLLAVAIIALGLALTFQFCLASMLLFGSACNICYLFKSWLSRPKPQN